MRKIYIMQLLAIVSMHKSTYRILIHSACITYDCNIMHVHTW